MIKKFLLISIITLTLSVNAGEYEDALKNNDKIFLYFYTKECGYCQKFTPLFEKFSNIYGEKCIFLKIDANSNYGRDLAFKFHVRFLPHVVLVDTKKEKGLVIIPNCLLQYACTNDVIKEFVE